eukprot:SAG22_NODE_3331_length_1774_cov_2.444179_1_plen_165_part_00
MAQVELLASLDSDFLARRSAIVLAKHLIWRRVLLVVGTVRSVERLQKAIRAFGSRLRACAFRVAQTVGPAFACVVVARPVAIANGVPIVQATPVVGEAVRADVVRRALREAGRAVEAGIDAHAWRQGKLPAGGAHEQGREHRHLPRHRPWAICPAEGLSRTGPE